MLIGCDVTPVAKDGDTVKVHYVGSLEDGTEFDSSRGKDPLKFELGKPGIIGGFQDGVRGMKVGEVKSVTIPTEEAYKMPRPELIQTLPRDQVPENITPVVGEKLTLGQPGGGRPMHVTITALTDSTITLDANHDLAGKALIFELELVEIVDPEKE
ncbi:MAG: FKBP-type peptidyl-prolyl cis-trans isomerase [candidate division Zixibacteria bacterium]|nr:FKBP-type peptidyl-prolyl cis-trans isomerase [candidate division Zixibacteria bacterium]